MGRITRRGFLQAGTLGLAAGALAAQGADAVPAKTRLVMVQDPGCIDANGVGHAETVREMVHRAVRELSGKESMAEAWGTFVKPSDVVGLKINLRGGPQLSPQPCVVNAIIEGVTSVGVAPNNIIVWDVFQEELEPAGYTFNNSSEGVRYLATDHMKPGADYTQDKEQARKAYSDEGVAVADKTVYFSRIMTDMVTALINVPMVKDHVIAGVTCAMKNHYGSILTPKDLHGNNCDPYLGELNKAPVIRDKTRLILVDGLRALYNGGPRDNPQYHWNPAAIIAGTDPVAVDALALKMVDEKRAEADMQPAREKAHYIESAAKAGVGTNNFEEMDLKVIRKEA